MLNPLDEKANVPVSNEIEHGGPGPGSSPARDGTEDKEVKEIAVDVEEV